jgi:hypothetical protein
VGIELELCEIRVPTDRRVQQYRLQPPNGQVFTFQRSNKQAITKQFLRIFLLIFLTDFSCAIFLRAVTRLQTLKYEGAASRSAGFL